MRKTRRVLFMVATVLCIAVMATGCAHTGLVAGESVDSPNVDRNGFVGNAGVEQQTIPDTKSQAEAYARSRKIPEALETAIDNVLIKAAKAIIKSEKALSDFSTNVPDTSIPDLDLPKITVKNQLDELETIGNSELESFSEEVSEEATENDQRKSKK